jgi:hypothetical protein
MSTLDPRKSPLLIYILLLLAFTWVVGVLLSRYISVPFWESVTLSGPEANLWEKPATKHWTDHVSSAVVVTLFVGIGGAHLARSRPMLATKLYMSGLVLFCLGSLFSAMAHLNYAAVSENPYITAHHKAQGVGMLVLGWGMLLFEWYMAFFKRQPPEQNSATISESK